MNETLVEFNGKMVKGQTYDPSSRESRIFSLKTRLDVIATEISNKRNSLKSLQSYANILLGKGVPKIQKHTIRINAPFNCEVMLKYSVPVFIPKDAFLMIKEPGKLVWSHISKADFFGLIRKTKEEIKKLDREYGILAKSYKELKESKEDSITDLLKLKEQKLKEIALIDEEIRKIK